MERNEELIGKFAIAFVQARRTRMAARKERTRAAVAFYDEFGGDATYSDQSDHPKGFTPEFIDATREKQAAYEAALKVEKSARQRLYAAVKSHERAALATSANLKEPQSP